MKTTITSIFFAILFISVSTISAQNPLTFGVKAGINFSDYSNEIENNDIKIGYNAGVTVDYKLSRFVYVLSGLEVTSKGTRVIDRDPLKRISPEYAKDKTIYNPLYLQLPVHAGYILQAAEDMVVTLHAGPYVAYGIAGKVTKKIERGENRTKERFNAFGSDGMLKRWDMGLGIGAGFEFKSMNVNFGYDLGILNASKGDTSIKNNNAHISLGYRFQ